MALDAPSSIGVLELPLSARQRIVVVEETIASRVNQELAKDPTPEIDDDATGDGPHGIADRARKLIRRKTNDAVAEIIRSTVRMRQASFDVRIISDSDARSLRFPPGHPTRKVLYVAHPVVPGQYYPAATFHRLVVEHKFAEAMDLLMELGARSIAVEQLRGYQKQDVLDILAAIPGVSFTAKSSKETEARSQITCVAELEGSSEPRLPDDLVWFPHEPMWKKLAENRLEGRLRKFDLAVRHLDSMSVDRELETVAKGTKFRLGGAFREYEEVVWRLSGEFPESSSR